MARILKKIAGQRLRKLIQDNYESQAAFAYDYGLDLRTVSRYVNQGLSDLDTIQELARYFNVDDLVFFKEEDL